MMCKVKKVSPLWGFLLSFPLWTVSCVDNKYDLDKDIDTGHRTKCTTEG